MERSKGSEREKLVTFFVACRGQELSARNVYPLFLNPAEMPLMVS